MVSKSAFSVRRQRRGIQVFQRYKPDAPEFPAVVLKISCNADVSQTPCISYEVPDGFSFDSIYFAEGLGGEYWTSNNEEGSLSYVHALEPDEEVRTTIGFEDVATEDLRTILSDGPTIELLDRGGHQNSPASVVTDDQEGSNGYQVQRHAGNELHDSPDTATEPVSGARQATTSEPVAVDNALEPRVVGLEARIDRVDRHEEYFKQMLGGPDSMDEGRFGAMRDDLEIVVELLSELREKFNMIEQDDTSAEATESIREELDVLVERVESISEEFDQYQSETEDRLDHLRQDLSMLEESNREFQSDVYSRLERLEEHVATGADEEETDDTK